MTPTPRQRYRRLYPEAMAGDPEAVHELRKLARRLTAQLKVADAPKGVRRTWRDVRRAASALRDHDVTGPLILGALKDLGILRSELKVVRIAWAHRRAALLAELDLPHKVPALTPVVKGKRWRRAVQKAARLALTLEPPQTGRLHVEEWHGWRKALKQYRAVLELREDVPEGVLTLLSVLGDAQDAQVLLDLASHEAILAPYRVGLGRAARAQRRQARHAAWTIWVKLRPELEIRNV